MPMNNKTYNEDSIKSLTPLEFTRLRPGVYIGSTEYSTQLLYEIVANAIDEWTLGHGNRIEITINNNIIKVRDYAQGFLINSIREDGKTVLEAAFSVLNTSAKYSDDGIYEGTALGLNGVGSKMACYLSHWLEVTSYRDGKYETVRFKEGIFNERKSGNLAKDITGTEVIWQPSEEFFTHAEVNIEEAKRFFTTIVCLCPGLHIILTIDEQEALEYYSDNGINDLVDKNVKDREIVKKRFEIKHRDNKNKLDLVMTYTNAYSSTIIPYINTGLTETGPHISQIKTIITREMNKFFRDKGWLKEKDENLNGEDCQEGMYLVFNITAPGVAYDAQTKSRVVKFDMKPFTQVIAEELQYWLSVNEKDIKQIADKALSARKAREAAKKARDAARDVNKNKNKKSLLDLPTKLIDCWRKKDRSSCELFVVEGDSAANSLVKGRDSEFQAIFPVRGKMISAYKNSSDKVFANQEINNLVKAIGLDVDTKTGKLVYDTKKLRYGKIVAAADADPDGKAIKNLLFTDIWWLCPELITNGHIYAAVPPLYRITTKKNKYIFLSGDKELFDYKNQHQGEKYLVSRNKG